jgi:hypothetical protein
MNGRSWPSDLRRLSPTEREMQMLAAAETVIRDEREHIVGSKDTDGIEWWGIGLSGGGIRSASLGLGVLQSLAEHDLLKRFHFISSVSGGGYIASSLQWWWSQGRLSPSKDSDKQDTDPAPPTRDAREAFGTRPYNFPYGPAHPCPDAKAAEQKTNTPSQTDPDRTKDQERISDSASLQNSASGAAAVPAAVFLPRAVLNLSFLRAHSAYLTPGHGLNIWSMIGVLLRTIIISLATWLPLLAIVMGLLFFLDFLIAEPIASWVQLYSPLGDAMPTAWKGWVEKVPLNLIPFRYSAIFALPLLLSYLSVATFVSAAVFFALVSRAPQNSTAPRSLRGPVVSIVAILLFIAILALPFRLKDASIIFILSVLTVFAGVIATTLIADYYTDVNLTPSYMLRRKLETAIGKLFIPTLVALALGTIPYVPYYIAKNYAAQGTITGLFGLAAGVLSALYGYYTFLRNIIPSLVGQIVATVGALLYLYATLVFAYFLIVLLKSPEILASGANADAFAGGIRIGIPLSMFLALAIASWGNINFVGLHRFYRDRLMEAFMPTNASVDAMTSQFSPVADNLSVSALDRLSSRKHGFPYPIINANAILINDSHRKYASRGGDNFIISPLYVGSTATGWRRTSEYIEGNGPLTLPTAMAASGAAASASAGYIGTGITMNPLVSAVMSLLNIRLGLWVGNPFFARSAKKAIRIPTFLNPGLVSGIFQQAHTFDSGYLELTDGGHFENLALYELVRRRTKIIVIVDGEADPNISLSSLVSAIRRIEEDFGATLEFEDGMGPDRLMMYPKERYPADARYAAAPFMIGKLSYRHAKEKDGLLIYIKSAPIEQMDFPTAGYLASNPEFPHQSTVDQFFDPAQFDAYRCLGYESTELALSALKKYKKIDAYPGLKDALTAPEAKPVYPAEMRPW